MPHCERYYALRQKWELMDAKLKAGNETPEICADLSFSLAYLRAHAEACEACIAAFQSAFPETIGKAFHMVSLVDED